MEYEITIPAETTDLGEIREAEHDVWKCLTSAMLTNMTDGGQRSSAEVCAWLLRLSVALQAYENAAVDLACDKLDYNEPGIREWWDDRVYAVRKATRTVVNKSWCVDATCVDGVYRILVEV